MHYADLVTEVSFGEGFGVGTSTDGVHFTDLGYVWHGPSWWNTSKTGPTDGHKYWEGSSAIWRAADFNRTGRYLINYSQMNTECSCQNITFAESYDLVHWSNGLELDEADTYPWFNIDTSLYQVSTRKRSLMHPKLACCNTGVVQLSVPLH